MDNHRFDITDENNLEEWIEVCASKHKAVGWASYPEMGGNPSRIVFFWVLPKYERENQTFSPLPFKAKPKDIAHIVKRWLEETEYPFEPDHDGDNCKGFRIYNEDWGHVDDQYEAFLAVSPAWAMYGK